jgi:hypothetical protein
MPPSIEYVGPPDGNGKWSIELRHFGELEKVLGRDVLNAFSRCFVHSDRLTSTISCIHTSETVHGRDSVAFERDLNTMVWFTIGTLREFARSLGVLRAALKRAGRLDIDSEPWVRLRKLEDRWERDEFYRKKRDTAAFHVDSDVIDLGLDELIKDQADVSLVRADDRTQLRSQLVLGFLSLHNGLGIDLAKFQEFVGAVWDDHAAVAEAIQTVFMNVAERAGIEIR